MDFSSKYIYSKQKQLQQQPQQQQQQAHEAISECLMEPANGAAASLPPPPPPPAPPLPSYCFAPRASYNRPMTMSTNRRFTDFSSHDDDDDDDEPDTNVVTIKFDKLKDSSTMQAGDAIKCNNCDAYLSSISKVTENKEAMNDDHKLWNCEFCGFNNNLQIDNEEIPKIDDVTYLLEPAPGVANAATAEDIHSEYVVYCIDISGSMSVTTKVNGNFRLPTDNIRRQRAEAMAGEQMYGGRVRERYISRLEAVQVAISENITKLVKESPNKKIGLVAFNQEVHVYGDGSTQEVVISGDFLNKKESIAEKAALLKELKAVHETSAVLNEKVLNLEEGGATALGPALYYSILIASRKPGSKVILCTDGLANKGIGALDTGEDQSTFYNELASFATNKGVSVSIITIKGTDCKLGLIAEVADKTGGLVNIVDPLNIRNEFASILEDQIIATNVVAKFLLHKTMYVKDYENFNNRQSVISKPIGNATLETEVTFEFAFKENIDENVTKEVPFQLQIVYNAKDGSKALRILTKLKPLTSDKNLAEAEADRTVLATHFVQTNTRLMQKGKSAENLYKKRHKQWNHYLNNNLAKNNDNFATEAYSAAYNEMSSVMEKTDDVDLCSLELEAQGDKDYTKTRRTGNAFSKISDEAASKGFKLANFKSKFFKK